MARPILIEFAGALYHVPLRGDRREPIYEHDADREWRYGERDAAMVAAHASGGYSCRKIDARFTMAVKVVRRAKVFCDWVVWILAVNPVFGSIKHKRHRELDWLGSTS